MSQHVRYSVNHIYAETLLMIFHFILKGQLMIFEVVTKGSSDGEAWAPPLFEALFKNSMLENYGDCWFQLSTKAGNCHEHTMAYKL